MIGTAEFGELVRRCDALNPLFEEVALWSFPGPTAGSTVDATKAEVVELSGMIHQLVEPVQGLLSWLKTMGEETPLQPEAEEESWLGALSQLSNFGCAEGEGYATQIITPREAEKICMTMVKICLQAKVEMMAYEQLIARRLLGKQVQ
jgi:hypothetical protein